MKIKSIIITFIILFFINGCLNNKNTNLKNFNPDICEFEGSIECLNWAISHDGNLQIEIKNQFDNTLKSVNLIVLNNCKSSSTNWISKENMIFICKVKSGNSGDIFKHQITLEFLNHINEKQIIRGNLQIQYS